MNKNELKVLESLIEENKLLKILADGCKKHPAYRAKRKVITLCETCNQMWDARQELINKEAKCEHKECYSKHYMDYNRICYWIGCKVCGNILEDLGFWDFIKIKGKYNIVEER